MLLFRMRIFCKRGHNIAPMSLGVSRRYNVNCCVGSLPRQLRRCFSSASTTRMPNRDQIKVVEEKGAAALSSRWLSELKGRIGKCITFGLRPEQVEMTGNILQILGTEWRDLVVGSEGFLTGPGRAGLERHGVVWGEMDSMQHVNNVTYVRYAESARVNWTRNYAMHIDPKHQKEWSELITPRGDGLILRSIRTDYKFPMTWPDRVSVYHKLQSPPSALTDSFTLDVIIISERQQRAAARCVEDIVVYDYRKGKKTPIRPFMAEAFHKTFRLQEEAKAKHTARVLELLRQVESLEKESWDRKDAKEDFGSAG